MKPKTDDRHQTGLQAGQTCGFLGIASFVMRQRKYGRSGAEIFVTFPVSTDKKKVELISILWKQEMLYQFQ